MKCSREVNWIHSSDAPYTLPILFPYIAFHYTLFHYSRLTLSSKSSAEWEKWWWRTWRYSIFNIYSLLMKINNVITKPVMILMPVWLMFLHNMIRFYLIWWELFIDIDVFQNLLNLQSPIIPFRAWTWMPWKRIQMHLCKPSKPNRFKKRKIERSSHLVEAEVASGLDRREEEEGGICMWQN